MHCPNRILCHTTLTEQQLLPPIHSSINAITCGQAARYYVHPQLAGQPLLCCLHRQSWHVHCTGYDSCEQVIVVSSMLCIKLLCRRRRPTSSPLSLLPLTQHMTTHRVRYTWNIAANLSCQLSSQHHTCCGPCSSKGMGPGPSPTTHAAPCYTETPSAYSPRHLKSETAVNSVFTCLRPVQALTHSATYSYRQEHAALHSCSCQERMVSSPEISGP